MLCIDTDIITPCLIDAKTLQQVNTHVYRIKSPSLLSDMVEETGWFTDWKGLLKAGCEVYVLMTELDDVFQGAVALKPDLAALSVWINWICAHPQNFISKHNPEKKYLGVGGHLFAIAANRSIELGYNGSMHGTALNRKIAEHYEKQFGAFYIGTDYVARHHVIFSELAGITIAKEYTYDKETKIL